LFLLKQHNDGADVTAFYDDGWRDAFVDVAGFEEDGEVMDASIVPH
jgi:hypothetical protein